MLEPGAHTEVPLQIKSHGVATQLLAVALREVKEEPSDIPKYIGIASANISFVDPIELNYDAWIESSHANAVDPLDIKSDWAGQILISFELKMVGDMDLTVEAITFRHAGLVSFPQP